MKKAPSLLEKVLRVTNQDVESKDSNLKVQIGLELKLLSSIDFSKPYKEAKREFVRQYLNDMLVLSFGNISKTAELANINRRHMHRLVNELHLNPDNSRKENMNPIVYLKEYISQISDDTDNEMTDLISEKLDLQSHINEDITSIFLQNSGLSTYEEALYIFEREYINKLLEENDFDIQKTASVLGISERTLYRKINKLNIAVA